jgi:pimeloyl-ACP methyl ester carboxylesterase
MQLTETFASSSGAVRWERVGDADAPSVVLAHGTPFSSAVWHGIATALAERYAVYVWDMPGYGASEMAAGQDVSIAAQGKVFAELLAHWQLDAPLVVAHDFGGAAALRAHLLHGARYERLALVDPVAVAPWESEFFALVREHADVFTQLPPFLHAALVREYIPSASARGLRPETLEQLAQPWLSQRGQPAFYRQIAQADQRHTDEMQDRYATIDVPVLICWGAQDAWIRLDRGRELAALIPGAQLRVFEGAGHLVQEDAPEQLTAALVGFLAGG